MGCRVSAIHLKNKLGNKQRLKKVEEAVREGSKGGKRLQAPGEWRSTELSMDPEHPFPVLPDQFRTYGAERVSAGRHQEKRRHPAFEGLFLYPRSLLSAGGEAGDLLGNIR